MGLWSKGGHEGLVLQSVPQSVRARRELRAPSVVPGLGTSRLVGQGTWFGPQMGILMGQGTQGDCSRAPTEIYGLGPVAWYCGALSIVPKLGSSGLGATQPLC